jgi:hypothetical protein
MSFKFESETVSFSFSFIFISFGESRLLVSWCACGRCGRATMRTVAGVGDLVQRTEDGCKGQVLGGRAVKRSGGAVCGLHLARGD